MVSTDMLKGIIAQGPVTSLTVAAVANAAAVFQLSNAAGLIGVKTFRLRKLRGRNRAGVNSILSIGTGAGATFAQALPSILTLNGMDFEVEVLPNVQFGADLTMWVDQVPVDVQVEVEEIA